MHYRFLLFLLPMLFNGLTLSGADELSPKRLYFRVQLKALVPSEVTVPPGTYDIVVENSITNGSLFIRLGAAQAGAKMAGASATLINEKTPDRALSSRHIVKLTAGRVLLTLGDNPNWTAVITVDAQP